MYNWSLNGYRITAFSKFVINKFNLNDEYPFEGFKKVRKYVYLLNIFVYLSLIVIIYKMIILLKK